jgi:ABC-type phosphate transport system substrate-binding protein
VLRPWRRRLLVVALGIILVILTVFIYGVLLAMSAYRKNEGKRTLRIVGSSSVDYMQQW